MKQQSLQGKTVTVWGLGVSGCAAVQLLLFLGADVIITDNRPAAALSAALEKLPAGMTLFAGEHPAAAYESSDFILLSPGVPLCLKALQQAKKQGIPIIGEVEFACRFITNKLIALTGTNGKSTTTSLLGAILTDAGYPTFIGGNLGHPVSQEVLQVLKGKPEPVYWVLEMSSFQLETIQHFKPFIGLFLNLSDDHLDRYKDKTAYLQAKLRLFMNQSATDYAIYNQNDPATKQLITKGKKIPFSSQNQLTSGCWLAEQSLCFSLNGQTGSLGSVDHFNLQGVANQENILAATAAALICSIPADQIKKTLQTFKGLEHRMETVATIKGVTFINDSKATNLDAVYKSLIGMKQPVILLAGGRSKKTNFSPLAPVIREKVTLLLLFGEAAQQIETDISPGLDHTTTLTAVDSLAKAVRLAYKAATPGTVVLLSPACASFDQFKNFEDRGQQFKQAVQSLSL